MSVGCWKGAWVGVRERGLLEGSVGWCEGGVTLQTQSAYRLFNWLNHKQARYMYNGSYRGN